MSQFIPGQRWISTTETDLGLGLITQFDGRRVEILFPASEEVRVYSIQNAPLARIVFSAGDEGEHEDGWRFTVIGSKDNDGIIIYEVESQTGERQEFPETRLSHSIQFNQAKDRLLAGQIDKNSWFEFRYQTLLQKEQSSIPEFFGLQGARVGLIPHQLHIANQVGRRYAPRVLLADEVGLGKTIEAGLILHSQILNGLAQRVLVVVPESLQFQWLVEMLRRFNLRFALFNEERWEEMDLQQENPFATEQRVICSLEFLMSDPNIADAAAAGEWDILVVDEAHHLHWSEEAPSEEYQAIEAIAQETPGILLLTATPEQLGIASHFARLRLLDPHRFSSLEKFIAEEEQILQLAEAVSPIIRGDDLSAEQLEHLKPWVPDIEAAQLESEESRQALLNQLIDQHGTSRIFFRNTRQAIKGFPSRHARPYKLPNPGLYDGFNEVEAQLFPNTATSEEEWYREDPRVDFLTQLMKDKTVGKVLVICAHRETAEALEFHLRMHQGIRTSIFHEGMSLLERDRAAAYFADPEQGAKCLICSEIGSEGRNFQFSHHLVLFDLPRHPDLLEQRIGRLDRIGQVHDIQIHIPYLEGTAQECLFRWYHEGLDAFSRTSSDGDYILQQVEQELIQALGGDHSGFDSLLEKTKTLHKAAQEKLQQGRDRLLEIHSSGQLSQVKVHEQIEEADDAGSVAAFMQRAFDQFGIDVNKHSEHAWVARPSDHMLTEYFPELPDEGLTLTFDRNQALEREDMVYLTWEHPMAQGVFDLVLSHDYGNTACAILKNKNIQPGTLFVEAIFRIHVPARKDLHINRFLDQSVIRVLTSDGTKDLAANVKHEVLNQQLQKLDRHTGKQVVQQVREMLPPLFVFNQDRAEQQWQQLQPEAIAKADLFFQHEIERMQQLQQRNPNIRDTEIAYLVNQQELIKAAIESGQVLLDSIRLLVCA